MKHSVLKKKWWFSSKSYVKRLLFESELNQLSLRVCKSEMATMMQSLERSDWDSVEEEIKTIPNQHRTDEELTRYSQSTFHERSFAAKTKRWLEEQEFAKKAILILVLVGTCMVTQPRMSSGMFLHL
ncbi:hypothetical protein GYH30_039577 [Glycine max]|nr:hypothetical protein GYH30_039577 [Glycine max]